MRHQCQQLVASLTQILSQKLRARRSEISVGCKCPAGILQDPVGFSTELQLMLLADGETLLLPQAVTGVELHI